MLTVEDAVSAARSKAHHQERMEAAEQQRDAGFADLFASGMTYRQIETAMRDGLVAAGMSPSQIERCGIGHHNIRRAIRDLRRSQ